MIDPSHEGRVFEPFSYHIERGKVNEFLLAVGEENEAFLQEDAPLPPTFPTVFTFWGGMRMQDALKLLDIDIWNVLHAEQEYEYLTPIKVGDTVTGQTRVERIYQRAGMDFMEFVTQYTRQDGQPVLNEKSLIIVRGEEA